jgi:hypothetical protein
MSRALYMSSGCTRSNVYLLSFDQEFAHFHRHFPLSSASRRHSGQTDCKTREVIESAVQSGLSNSNKGGNARIRARCRDAEMMVGES